MRFCVCVIKPLIDVGGEVVEAFVHSFEAFVDVGSEFFKPLIDVRRVIVEAFVHGVKAFVDVGSEVVEAFVYSVKAFGYSFEPDVHCALQPFNL